MDRFIVQIPQGVKIRGATADGEATAVLPGEYLVHDLRPKGPSAGTLLRLVGADALGRDVHVSRESVKRFICNRAIDLIDIGLAEAA